MLPEMGFFDNLDRLLLIEMRPPGLPRGTLLPLYRVLRRDDDDPLLYSAANAILQRPPGPVLIVTGMETDRFPQGEIDGPLGAVAVARAVSALGYAPTIVVDSGVVRGVRDVAQSAGLADLNIQPGNFRSSAEAADFARGYPVCIATEKLGENARGVRHSIRGLAVSTGDPYGDVYVRSVSEAGGLTVGIGDNGNEIGFGKLYLQARDVVPRGAVCECACGDGIIAATSCDHLILAAVSNYGAYALVAALALLKGRPELAVTGEEVTNWVDVAIAAGCRNGGFFPADFAGDDGIPITQVAAHTELIRGIVLQAFVRDPEK